MKLWNVIGGGGHEIERFCIQILGADWTPVNSSNSSRIGEIKLPLNYKFFLSIKFKINILHSTKLFSFRTTYMYGDKDAWASSSSFSQLWFFFSRDGGWLGGGGSLFSLGFWCIAFSFFFLLGRGLLALSQSFMCFRHFIATVVGSAHTRKTKLLPNEKNLFDLDQIRYLANFTVDLFQSKNTGWSRTRILCARVQSFHHHNVHIYD